MFGTGVMSLFLLLILFYLYLFIYLFYVSVRWKEKFVAGRAMNFVLDHSTNITGSQARGSQ